MKEHLIFSKNEIKMLKNRIEILDIILVSSMILAVFMVIFSITIPKNGENFTEFYILNSTGGTDYPTKLSIGDNCLKIGVINHEYSLTNYTIVIVFDKNILTSQTLMLKNGEKLEKNISFVLDKKGSDLKLEFLLFKEYNFTLPYRELYLWINST